jgi:hypothetical protein
MSSKMPSGSGDHVAIEIIITYTITRRYQHVANALRVCVFRVSFIWSLGVWDNVLAFPALEI